MKSEFSTYEALELIVEARDTFVSIKEAVGAVNPDIWPTKELLGRGKAVG